MEALLKAANAIGRMADNVELQPRNRAPKRKREVTTTIPTAVWRRGRSVDRRYVGGTIPADYLGQRTSDSGESERQPSESHRAKGRRTRRRMKRRRWDAMPSQETTDGPVEVRSDSETMDDGRPSWHGGTTHRAKQPSRRRH